MLCSSYDHLIDQRSIVPNALCQVLVIFEKKGNILLSDQVLIRIKRANPNKMPSLVATVSYGTEITYHRQLQKKCTVINPQQGVKAF